jgi:hypothetical protein
VIAGERRGGGECGAGEDVLVIPAKSRADAAGIVLGARVPVILTSRADSVMTRLASWAVAALVAKARRDAGAKTVA